MYHVLRAALIGAALVASGSAVLALDGDANPVPNNADMYQGYDGYAYGAPYAQPERQSGVRRAPTVSERRALSRGYEIR
jgi:hypothetical protein